VPHRFEKHKTASAFLHFVQGRLHNLLALIDQNGLRLVEDQDFGILDNGTGNCHALEDAAKMLPKKKNKRSDVCNKWGLYSERVERNT